MPAFVFLACWLSLNAWVSHRLLAARPPIRMRAMHVAFAWIVPILGALMGLLELRGHRQRHAALVEHAAQEEAAEPAPDHLQAPGLEDWPFAERLHVVAGVPLADWRAIEAWLAAMPDARARAAARVDAHRAWLEHLRDALGDGAWLHETDDAFVLSSLEPAVAAATARYVATTRRRIAGVLGALPKFPAGEKSIVLVLDDEEVYYHYVSIYYPREGEFAFSGGMFVDAGCPHFVVRRADLSTIEPVIAHELTHSALAHLRLPLWLDEGLAVNTEHKIAGDRHGRHPAREMHARHLKFWGEAEIGQFWSGESFRRADDGNALSYDLARIMVAQMSRSWPAFERFVQHAARADAGNAAALAYLDVDLGAYACLLLEQEPQRSWSPPQSPCLSASDVKLSA
jgi:hypothetical protein